MPDALVIGGGLAGLASAVALSRQGWQVAVLERAATLEPVGAGIALTPNAERALDALGLGEQVRSLSALQGDVGMRRPDGRWLWQTDATVASDRLGGSTVVLHRSQLVGILEAALPDGALRLDTRVMGLRPAGPGRSRPVATLGDPVDPGDPGGEELEADLVVAADGIDSASRSAVFPGHPAPVYTGVTAWRFVAPAPTVLEPAETWGRGSVVGLAPLADGRAYCYATAVLPEGTLFPDDAAELRRRFADWHAPIPELLAGLAPGDVLHHDLRWLARPLPRYDVGGVAFVGDAAHAMPPNLGQGGCQALEDAVVLGYEMGRARSGPDAVERALAAYTAARLERTSHIAKLSARAGAPTAWTSPVATWLRELATRAVGRFAAPMLMRQMEPIIGWRPPGSSR